MISIEVLLYRIFFCKCNKSSDFFDIDSSVPCFETFIIDRCFAFDSSNKCISEGDCKCVIHLKKFNLSIFSALLMVAGGVLEHLFPFYCSMALLDIAKKIFKKEVKTFSQLKYKPHAARCENGETYPN